MEWSNDMVLEFLNNFEAEPIIWDPKHPDHKKKHLVFEAWRRLKNNLSFEESTSIEDLKRKKDSLMAYYRIHLTKIRNVMKSGNENTYRTDWFAFSAMHNFLAPVYKVTSITIKTEEKNDEGGTSCHFSTPDEDNESLRSIQSNRSVDETSVRKKPKQEMSELELAKKQLDDVYAMIAEKATVAKTEDMHECDLYAELLSRKLKKLDEERRFILMHNIDNLVFQEIMSARAQERVFVESSYSRSPSPSK